MRVLGIDGGAERLGWAIVEDGSNGPVYLGSGLVKMPRDKGVFQEYRLEFIEAYVRALTKPGSILDQSLLEVDEVVNETVPAVGSFRGTQMYLVNVGITVIQTLAIERGIKVSQIGATTVQSMIVGKRAKGVKVTKPQVRNGVISLLPELAPRKRDWVKHFDEPDAIAVALAHLGYKN